MGAVKGGKVGRSKSKRDERRQTKRPRAQEMTDVRGPWREGGRKRETIIGKGLDHSVRAAPTSLGLQREGNFVAFTLIAPCAADAGKISTEP